MNCTHFDISEFNTKWLKIFSYTVCPSIAKYVGKLWHMNNSGLPPVPRCFCMLLPLFILSFCTAWDIY